MVVLQVLLVCSLLVVLLRLPRAARFLLRCLKARQNFIRSSVPGPPAGHPILGHAAQLLGPKSPWNIANWVNAYGPVVKVQLMDEFGVVLTDPDTIARVTRKTGPGPYLPKPHHLYEALESGYSPKRPNILTSNEDAYWKAVRQAAAPCFSMSSVKQVVPLVLSLSKTVSQRMSHQPSFDITDAAKRITSDVMGHLLYGEDLRGVTWEPSEYLEVFYPQLKAQANMLSNPLYLWKLWDPEVRHQRYCFARHNQMVTDKVQRLRRHPPAPHTVAGHLLSAIDPATGQPLDDTQIKAEVSTFMAAGFETTSHAITWTLTMLASHPDIQEEVYAELKAAGLAATGSTPGRDFAASDLGRLPLLSAVIKESLRLCAPAPFGGSRQVVCEGGTEICGHHLPKGTVVLIFCLPLALAHHVYGPDVLLFKPQRWTTSTTDAAANTSAGTTAEALGLSFPAAAAAAVGTAPHASDTPSLPAAGGSDHHADGMSGQPAPAPAGPGASLQAAAAGSEHDDQQVATGPAAGQSVGSKAAPAGPPDPISFLTGPRDCIGQNLAKLELQVVLATLLSRFRFSPGPELQQELSLAAATGQPPVKAVHALAGAFITLQPLAGKMVLKLDART